MKINEGIPQQINLPHKCHSLRWTPDGTRILYLSGPLRKRTIWTVSLDGSDPILVYANAGRYEYPTYSNDGKLLFFKSIHQGNRELWWVPLNKKGKAIKPAKVLRPGINCYKFSISADGTKLAYMEGSYNINIYTIPSNTDRVQIIRDATQITTEAQNMIEIAMSPNYERITFNSVFRGSVDIWFVHRSGNGLRQFTADTCIENGLSWSPDSSLLAYHSNRNGNNDIWTIPVNGGPPIPLTTHSAWDEYP